MGDISNLHKCYFARAQPHFAFFNCHKMKRFASHFRAPQMLMFFALVVFHKQTTSLASTSRTSLSTIPYMAGTVRHSILSFNILQILHIA